MDTAKDGYSPVSTAVDVDRVVQDAKDFAFISGLLMRTKDNTKSADDVAHAPFTLFPTPLPRRCFMDAQVVQMDFNLLMHRIARNPEFLYKCLHRVIETDDFIHQLWHICETVHKETFLKSERRIMLAMNRSDFMIGCEASDDEVSAADVSKSTLKQIEFNTMSAGAAGLAVCVNKIHRFLISRYAPSIDRTNIPENCGVAGLADALVMAWNLYGNPSAVILFLVYEIEPNVYDQRWLENSVYMADNSIKVIRRTFDELKSRSSLSADSKLIVDDMEVAIVYMRSCYKPTDYKTDDDWNVRLMIERSKAIVCPTAAYQLAGTKKVQQMLCEPGTVEQFIDDEAAVRRIRSTFAEQLSLDTDEEGENNARLAINRPHLYVMKPQREGGGNNVFGESIREKLQQMSATERSSYILMKKIKPLVLRNYAVAWRKNQQLLDVVSEIGIYGSLISVADEVVLNKEHGYLMRTKRVDDNEGGLMSGTAFLDSPYLWNDCLPDGNFV